jgi:uncharacterized protein (TIGR03382 family)
MRAMYFWFSLIGWAAAALLALAWVFRRRPRS